MNDKNKGMNDSGKEMIMNDKSKEMNDSANNNK